jgi:hypothetical protein
MNDECPAWRDDGRGAWQHGTIPSSLTMHSTAPGWDCNAPMHSCTSSPRATDAHHDDMLVIHHSWMWWLVFGEAKLLNHFLLLKKKTLVCARCFDMPLSLHVAESDVVQLP